ncbi:MAG TPA: TraR/DksA family transcriptional regulator [Woeseiaceae bacterium]
MENDIEPVVGNWYQHLDDGTLFQVTAMDEDESLVEFQNFDGDIGEVSLDEWRNWDIEVSDPPEDWTGPVDDIEIDDLDYSEIRSAGERRGIAEDRRSERLQHRGLPGDDAEGEDYTDDELVEGRTAGRESPPERVRPTRGMPSTPSREREDGLSRDEVVGIKTRLTERADYLRRDIQRELRKYENESYTQLAERVADPGDQAWADVVADMNLAEVTRDVGELRLIDRALERLAEGNYGICIACGDRIDPGRLEANPAAIRCLECQREHEARSMQTRSSL